MRLLKNHKYVFKKFKFLKNISIIKCMFNNSTRYHIDRTVYFYSDISIFIESPGLSARHWLIRFSSPQYEKLNGMPKNPSCSLLQDGYIRY